jgi:hypothetical protein
MASPIIHRGFVYIPDRRGGILTCYHAADGKEAYKERLPGEREFWASPWVSDDRIFCLDDAGATHVLASGEKYQLLHSNQLEGRFWASVAVSDGILLLRSSDSLYCVQEGRSPIVRAVQVEAKELLPTRR